MIEEQFQLDDCPCQGYRFLPDDGGPRAVMHVNHGMGEHALRYRRLAEALVADGWAVYTHDQRGHGATVKNEADYGHFGDPNGWKMVVDDLGRFINHATNQHPRLPVVAFGHSMGSIVLQDYVTTPSAATLAALVLSGISGPPPLIARLGVHAARLECLRLGNKGRSPLLRALTFDAYNKEFKPNRTGSDWLSKDPAEVDKYVEDPKCGFDGTNYAWFELLSALSKMMAAERLALIPQTLPIYVFAGAEDPVGRKGVGVKAFVSLLRRNGFSDVEAKLYPTGRHEMLNEINREEVANDLKAWLRSHDLPPAG